MVRSTSAVAVMASLYNTASAGRASWISDINRAAEIGSWSHASRARLSWCTRSSRSGRPTPAGGLPPGSAHPGTSSPPTIRSDRPERVRDLQTAPPSHGGLAELPGSVIDLNQPASFREGRPLRIKNFLEQAGAHGQHRVERGQYPPNDGVLAGQEAAKMIVRSRKVQGAMIMVFQTGAPRSSEVRTSFSWAPDAETPLPQIDDRILGPGEDFSRRRPFPPGPGGCGETAGRVHALRDRFQLQHVARQRDKNRPPRRSWAVLNARGITTGISSG